MYLDEFIDEYECCLRDRFEELIGQIRVIEAGVGRAVSAVLAGKRPRDLPKWETVKEIATEDYGDIWWEQDPKRGEMNGNASG